MAKELRTAEQLADMIVAVLGISEIYVCCSQRPCLRVAADGGFVSRQFHWLSKAR